MDMEEELQAKLGEEGLEERIGETIEAYHGLLNRKAAIRVIARSEGLIAEEKAERKLSQIPSGARKLIIRARVRKVHPTFEYRSGKRSRVLEIEDDSGSRPLVLWNQDTLKADDLRSGDELLVKGAYERNGEVHFGYSASLAISKKAPVLDPGHVPESGLVHVRGRIRMEGDGSLSLEGEGGSCRIAFKHDAARVERLEEGDELLLEGAIARDGELEVVEGTRVLWRREREMLIGKVERLEAHDGLLEAEVGGRKALFGRDDAMRFLGVKAAEDITLETLVSIRGKDILNKPIALRVCESGGRTSIAR